MSNKRPLRQAMSSHSFSHIKSHVDDGSEISSRKLEGYHNATSCPEPPKFMIASIATSTSSPQLSFQPTYPQAPQSQSCAVDLLGDSLGCGACHMSIIREKNSRRAIKGSCPIIRDLKTGTCFSLAQVALCFQSINQHGLTPGTVLPSWCVVHNNGTIHSYMVHAKCIKHKLF